MTDLAVFLLARIADDERTAEAASPGPWSPNAERDEVVAVDGITVADGFALSANQLRATVEHIARHDPARVLARCEADRRIVALHEDTYIGPERWGDHRLTPEGAKFGEIAGGSNYSCPTCDHGDDEYDPIGHLGEGCPTLRALAAVYAFHPDYQESWRPA